MKKLLSRQTWYFFKNDKTNEYKLVEFVPSPESPPSPDPKEIKQNLKKPAGSINDMAAYVFFFSKIRGPNKILQSRSTPNLKKYRPIGSA